MWCERGGGASEEGCLLRALGVDFERRPLGGERSHLLRSWAVLFSPLRVACPHVALTLEHDAFLDDQTGRRDVSVELARRADLEAFLRRDISRHPALDHDRVADDLRVDHCALADRERVLGSDLAFDVPFDSDRALECELADDTAPLPQEGVAPAADVIGHDSTPLPLRGAAASSRGSGCAEGGRQQRTPIISLSILPEYRHRMTPRVFEPRPAPCAP